MSVKKWSYSFKICDVIYNLKFIKLKYEDNEIKKWNWFLISTAGVQRLTYSRLFKNMGQCWIMLAR